MADNLRVQQVKREVAKDKKAGKAPRVHNIIKTENDFAGIPPKGEKFSTCKTCGKTFEQDLMGEKNVYSNYKTCLDCRHKERRKKEKESDIGEGKLASGYFGKLDYTPLEWQMKAHKDLEKNRFQVLACGNRCFDGDSFMSGCNKKIKDIKIGDRVLGNNGKLNRISYAAESEYHGNMYTVKGMGCLPFTVTEQHKVLVAEVQRNLDKKNKNNIIISEEFIPVEKIKEYKSVKHGNHVEHYLKIPIPQNKVKCDYWKFDKFEKNYKNQLDGIPLNEDTSWLFGLYCAEGCYQGKGGSKLTLNYNENEIIEKAVRILVDNGYSPNVRERKEEGTTCIIVSKIQYARKLDSELGHGSLNKKIPDTILYNENKNILISFLKGYFSGDGYYNEKIERLEAYTASVTLALQLQLAIGILNGFGKITSFTRKDRNANTEYEVTTIDKEFMCLLGYEAIKEKRKSNYIIKKDCIYTPVSNISIEYKDAIVYDLTSKDGTLSCFNVVTHNSGKDRYTNMAGIMYFVDCLNENRHIDNPEIVPSVYWWQLAPTEKLALQNWRELKQFFPKEWVVAVSDSTMTMQTIGGGIIEVRSAYDPESLVGVGLDLVTITEAARIKNLDVVWANIEARLSSPSRGRIKDRMGKKYGFGKAIVNSSPLGKNYFYKMWTWGQKNHPDFSSDWISYQLPWTCNPSNKELASQIKHTKYGDITYGEDLRRRLGDRAYRQNYLADFLASGGTVFGDFEEKCLLDLYSGEFINYTQTKRKEFIENWQKPRPYTTYRLAWDIATGSSGDTPTLGIRDNETYNIVKIIDLYGKNYDQQYEEIAYWSRVYNYAPCVFSSTGHTACVGQLEKKGVTEIVVNEQGGNKISHVQSLERATQNGAYKILDDGSETAQTLIFQMQDYTEKNGKYSNDTENHDDWVSMLYLMFHDFSVQQFETPFMGLMSSLD